MEELLKQLLSGQQQIIQRLDNLEGEVSAVKTEVLTVKTELSTVTLDLASLKTDLGSRISKLENELSVIKSEVSAITEDMGSKTQLHETVQIVKAIQHNSEVLTAKIDWLTVNTASKDIALGINKTIDRMAADVSFLARKAIEHDDDIRELRRAK